MKFATLILPIFLSVFCRFGHAQCRIDTKAFAPGEALTYNAYYNWGIALGELSKMKTGQEAEKLLNQAFKKYKKATRIEPNDHNAWDSWGVHLAELAKTRTGKEAEDLFTQSFKKHQKAIECGGTYYNLSCWYALTKNKENALLWLEKSLRQLEITTDFVLKDEDWSSYLHDEDFLRIIDCIMLENTNR